jgi:hypothetical protein
VRAGVISVASSLRILPGIVSGKERSRESQLLLTIQDLADGLTNGEQIDYILLDFSKAFDKVPHQRLINILVLGGR